MLLPGDMAIDNFGVVEAAANDLAIVAAVAPTGCELTNAEPIEVWVVNQGLVSETLMFLMELMMVLLIQKPSQVL